MVLITTERKQALKAHYGTNAYIGRAMCDMPLKLITDKTSVDQATLRKIYDELSAHGRKLFNTSIETVKDVSWKMIANTNTVPVFLISLKKALQKMKTATGASLENAVCVMITAAARFWEYLSSFFTGTKRTLETTREEVMSCADLLSRFGDTAIRAIRWISSGVYKMVEAILSTISNAAIWMGNVTGQYTKYLYDNGVQGATEFILLIYSTLHEMATHDTDKSYMATLGVEMARFVNSLSSFVSEKANRVIDFFGITGGLIRILKWVTSFIKAFYTTTMDLVYGIFCQILGSLKLVIHQMALSTDDIYKQTQTTFDFSELAKLGHAASLNQSISKEHRERVAFATRTFEKFTKENAPSSPVRPWLMAKILRDIYYDVEPDEEIAKMIIEDRTGLSATEYIERLGNCYQLLENEIWLAYRSVSLNVPEETLVVLKSQAMLIEGWNCWFGSCRKTKDDKGKDDVTEKDIEDQRKGRDDAINESRAERLKTLQNEREQIARVRTRDNVYFYLDTRDPQKISSKLALLGAELSDAYQKLRKEEADVADIVRMIENQNKETALNMIDQGERRLAPGQTVITNSIIKKTKQFGIQRLDVVEEKKNDALELVEQIEFEISELNRGMIGLSNAVNLKQRKFSKRILMIAFVGGLIFTIGTFIQSYYGSYSQTWDAMREKTVALGMQNLFDLWQTKFEASVSSRSWYDLSSIVSPVTVVDIEKVALTSITNLRRTTFSSETFADEIVPFFNAAIGIQQRVVDATIKNFAASTVQAIQTAIDTGTNEAIKAARERLIMFLETAQEYMLKGAVPDNIVFSLVGKSWDAVYGATAAVGGFFFKQPGYATLTPAGMLSVAALGAGELQLIAIEKLFKAAIGITGGFVMLALFTIFRTSYIAAFMIETNAELGAIVMSEGPKLIADLGTIAGPMFIALKESAEAQNAIFFGGIGALIAIGLRFLPGYALFSGAKDVLNILTNARKAGDKPSELAAKPFQEKTDVGEKEQKPILQQKQQQQQQVKQLEAVSVYDAYQTETDKIREQTTKNEMETELISVAPMAVASRRKRGQPLESIPSLPSPDQIEMSIGCSICNEPSTLICDHCDKHTYCNMECASIDWMGINNHNHTQVHY